MATVCPFKVGFDLDGNAIPLTCGAWTCTRCRRTLARQWAKRALLRFGVLPDGQPALLWFLTLTLGSKYQTPVQGYAAIPGLWDKTRKAFQRRWTVFDYMAFVEGQPKRGGMPHFHILTSKLPPCPNLTSKRPTEHDLHDWAHYLGWGFQAKLEHVHGHKAAYYVTKYSSKGDPFMPKSFRRVRVSRGWPELPETPDILLFLPRKLEGDEQFIERMSRYLSIDALVLAERYYAAKE